MTADRVTQAYSRRAQDYVDALGSMTATHQADRDLIRAWAEGLGGPVLDVGCGPGQWTAWLHGLGVDVEGVDPVAEFLEDARTRYPEVSFRFGRAEDLDVPAGSLAGILAWYSLIHSTPEVVDAALSEFARALRPGGGLIVGFFEGPELEAFDHTVVSAYFWPIDLLCDRVESAGFEVSGTHTRAAPGARPHGAIIAARGPGAGQLSG